MFFTVNLAGIIIQIESFTSELQDVFHDYLSNQFPDLTIRLTADMIAEESRTRQDYAQKCRSDFALSDKLSEESAACRAIAEKVPGLGAFLLHGSAISYNGKGIVFVASSGTGKSTFSRSWNACFPEAVRYINDDKPFVRIINDKATLWGSPWNGKHHLGENTSCPLKAIFLLERSETNWTKKVSAMEVLPELLSHLYIPENPIGRTALFSTIQLLSQMVSFYRVGCNLDPDAALTCREAVFPS